MKIVCALIVIVTGISVFWLGFSLSSPFSAVRRIAVHRQSDPTILEAIIAGDIDVEVRLAAEKRLVAVRVDAVQKLADPAALAEAVITARDFQVREAAFERLFDESALIRVATNAREERVREGASIRIDMQGHDAVSKLSDQEGLALIAMNHFSFSVRSEATVKLTPDGLSSAAEKTNDPRRKGLLLAASAILRGVKAIPVPANFQRAHRLQSLPAELLPIATIYADPLWISRFGVVRQVTVRQEDITKHYSESGRLGSRSLFVDGETIVVEITFSKSPHALKATGKTKFPEQVTMDTRTKSLFYSAGVSPADLFIPWLSHDQESLAKLAFTSNNSIIRNCVVEAIIDVAVLSRIATDDADGFLRETAVGKLNDTATLSHVAVHDSSERVRKRAVEQLRDAKALAVIAGKDEDESVRQAAKRQIIEVNSGK